MALTYISPLNIFFYVALGCSVLLLSFSTQYNSVHFQCSTGRFFSFASQRSANPLLFLAVPILCNATLRHSNAFPWRFISWLFLSVSSRFYAWPFHCVSPLRYSFAAQFRSGPFFSKEKEGPQNITIPLRHFVMLPCKLLQASCCRR